jgi:hypothetical protein
MKLPDPESLETVFRVKTTYIYPGSENFHPGSRVKNAPGTESESATKKLSVLAQIIVTKHLEI